MARSLSRRTRIALVLAPLALALFACGYVGLLGGQEGPGWKIGLPRQHNSKWLVHDLDRPKPVKVEPGASPGAPPADAIVLFDGTDFSKWIGTDEKPVNWAIEDGAAVQRTDSNQSIRTVIDDFEDLQLHIEWANPAEPKGASQARGNSGIFFMGAYELQILDNHDNPTYADGYVGAIYGQQPPLANAARPSGEWQVYDVVFRRPRWEGDKVVEPGRLTVFHNGVVVQHNGEIYGETVWRQRAEYRRKIEKGPISIQDHGDKQAMRFRNIWVRRLDLSPTD